MIFSVEEKSIIETLQDQTKKLDQIEKRIHDIDNSSEILEIIDDLPNKCKLLVLVSCEHLKNFTKDNFAVSQITRMSGEIKDILDPIGVAVVLEGRHLCMQMRGVEKQNSFATTSAMLGELHDHVETRNEFLSIIGLRNI